LISANRNLLYYWNCILKANAKNINALVLQGSVLSRTKKFQQALECYEEALKIDPNHVPALVRSGRVLEDIDENSKAKTYFERAISLNSTQNDPAIVVSKGNAFLNLDNAKELHNKN
jgi:tetratricopeptide (TPR) repeat protein